MKNLGFMLVILCLLGFNIPVNAQDAESVVTGDSSEPQAPVEPVEGNVWTTEDGTRYYHCPVMGGEGKVDGAKAFSVIDGVKYYHCCPPCQGPFRSNPEKWLSALALPANIITVDQDGLRTFRDPVDGQMKLVKKDTDFMDLDGKRYFFGSKKTMKKFGEDPESYLN